MILPGSSPGSGLRIVVSGLVAQYPVGGVAWDYLQYAIGLHRAGHEVVYHEDTWIWPYDPVARTRTRDAGYSASFLRRFFRTFAPELETRWHYRHLDAESHGMSQEAFREFASSADLFLNVSGANRIPADLPSRCVRAFIDTDPGYNQIVLSERPVWSENVDRWADSVRDHEVHFTYAENIRAPECTVPTLGIDWRPTRMPVVMELWADVPNPPGEAWTTVMTWNAFPGPLVYGAREYGSKDVEFERVIDLPKRASVPLEVALGGEDAPAERLESAGWRVVDAQAKTRTAEEYREYLGNSRGEFSVAKNVYVATRSGWFSCRSACYLASGRPVVVQDTGFRSILPTGEGIVSFDDVEEAAAAIREVEGDYPRHAEAAKEIAETCFGAGDVLGRLLEDALGDGP